MSDPSPSGETWVCTAANALTSPCTERRPHDFGGSTCGPVPSSDTPRDERANAAEDATWSCKIGPASRGDLPSCSDAPMRTAVEAAFRKLTGHDPEWTFSGWAYDLTEAERAVVEHRLPRPQVIAAAARKQMERAEAVIGTDLDPEPAPPPTPVDGDSGRRGKAQIMATALHDAGVNTTVSASDNGLLIRVHDRHTPRLLELLAPPPVGEERRPVDGGERSQSEQWFVVHHNQIRSLRFGTFPIERLARASIAACTCGPHTLRHTVTTTYTASTTEEFVAAAADRGEG